jgi:hypothetical protein
MWRSTMKTLVTAYLSKYQQYPYFDENLLQCPDLDIMVLRIRIRIFKERKQIIVDYGNLWCCYEYVTLYPETHTLLNGI